MSKITDYDTLAQKMVDIVFEQILDDRNDLNDIVWQEALRRVENMDVTELQELAIDAGFDVELEDE